MEKARSFLVLLVALVLGSCGTLQKVNLFTVQQDAELGAQVAAEIENNPQQYPILAEKGNEEAYAYLRNLRDQILNSGAVRHKDAFVWQVKIVKDDDVLNAFCTPGGYIYVYTGLIKFLDTEDQLLGVLGHEIAHADMRHSTKQLTQIYGSSILLEVATGGKYGMLREIATGLGSLAFSRSDEREADAKSVDYLCGSRHNAAGAAGFFQKMEGRSQVPEFLSTHPNPGNRVRDIQTRKEQKACTGEERNQSRYQRFKQLL
jgi:beta-barrel assembly-enhancing protease